MNKIMVLKGGSPAIHKLGDIGRLEDDFIRVKAEDDTNYIGHFEEGLGFVNVLFKKSDCRELTKNEVDRLNNMHFCINGASLGKYNIDINGNIIATNK